MPSIISVRPSLTWGQHLGDQPKPCQLVGQLPFPWGPLPCTQTLDLKGSKRRQCSHPASSLNQPCPRDTEVGVEIIHLSDTFLYIETQQGGLS